jgi:7-cyano-7-deazaguanine synthase
MKKCVVLLSGGLDSTTVIAEAQAAGYACHALSVAYGQRHEAELLAAARIAKKYAIEHRVMHIDYAQMGGSALTDKSLTVPTDGPQAGIPITYVPARNTLFLSLALGWAEVLGARDIFVGVNAVDYSGYPDCRPAFIEAFQRLANLATKAGVESENGQGFTVHTPIIHASKAEIIQRGLALGVDYAETVSCYQADAEGHACGVCDSCHLRKQGFAEAGIADPTRYYA